MKRSLFLATWITLAGTAFSADEISSLLKDLEAEDFKTRETAVEELAVAADRNMQDVASVLWGKRARIGPEARARVPAVLKKLFERQCLGAGEAETGITFSLFVTGDAEQGATGARAMIAAVGKDSPADKCGLKAGDVVVSWNGESIEGVESVRRVKKMLRMSRPGAKVSVQVERRKIVGNARLEDKGSLQDPVEMVLGEIRSEPLQPARKGTYEGWLEQMRMDYNLPEAYAVSQP